MVRGKNLPNVTDTNPRRKTAAVASKITLCFQNNALFSK
jgi:hypothetical protein